MGGPRDVIVTHLTTEYQRNPMPLDTRAPRFGWWIDGGGRRGVTQVAYEVVVTTADAASGDRVVWGSGRVPSSRSVAVEYAGPALEPRTRYHWAVRVWVDGGAPTAWSETAWWETGIGRDDWRARWVEPVQRPAQPDPAPSLQDVVGGAGTVDRDLLNPAQYVRAEFTVRPGLVRARVYATAHGVYTAELNGRRLGDQELAPETTAYERILQYQAYDATSHVREGGNAVGFVVADGWWAGRLGMTGEALNYGDRLGLLAQVELLYADGSLDVIGSDARFRASTGAVVHADLLVGERIDARREPVGWTLPGFDDRDWTPVEVTDLALDNIVPQVGEPVRVIAELPCIAARITSDGGQILDFGQLVTGHVRVRLADLEPGTEITVRHAQVVDGDGDLVDTVLGRHNENLDSYVARGGPREVFEPRHTFHAFRYVRIDGLPYPIDPGAVTAVAISSDVPVDLTLRTSDARVDRLAQNVLWTLRDNFVSIPMDNPDRERAGWTGDLAVIARTAAVHLGLAPFLRRFLDNVAAEQFPDGTVPMVVPFFAAYRAFFGGIGAYTSAGWGDVATIVPWAAYRAYGDERMLADHYGTMQAFHDSAVRAAERSLTAEDRADPDLSAIRRAVGFHFGDWLTPSTVDLSPAGSYTVANGLRTMELTPTLYLTHSTDVLADVAGVLGRSDDEVRYRALAARLRRGFRTAFVTDTGRLTLDLQGSYVLALAFRMAPDLDEVLLARLQELIGENGGHLDTGFPSTAFLLPVLTDHGLGDLAYSLLFAEGHPSWMFMLEHGATTVWEMWQGVAEDGTPRRASFVQPGLATVGAWLAEYVAGIRPGRPGYERVHLHPVPGPGLDRAEGRYRSVRGEITSHWRRAGDELHLDVTIPGNTDATVTLEGARLDEVRLDGAAVAGHPDVRSAEQRGARVVLDVGSGTYRFTHPLHPAERRPLPATTAPPRPPRTGRYDLTTDSYHRVVADADARAVVARTAPELAAHPVVPLLGELPFELVLRFATTELGQDRAAALRAELAALA